MGVRTRGKTNSVSCPSLPLRYGLAIASIIVALGFHLLLDSLLIHGTFLPLILGVTMLCASVVLSAWYGGLGPGLLATALAALIAGLSFCSPDTLIFGSQHRSHTAGCVRFARDVYQLAGRGVEIC
jgi:hypothetical protein